MPDKTAPHRTPRLSRRDVLRLAGSAILVGAEGSGLLEAGTTPGWAASSRSKRVIVAGGGIAGLCCAYELMKRGHDVTVLEARGRTGGHVRTITDPFPDGLYLDAGAENFNKPGYDLYWGYVREFNLVPVYYPQEEIALRFINGKMYTPEMLQDRRILAGLGFNQRECNFLAHQPWWNLSSLYLDHYTDRFRDECQPFTAGLDYLDQITVAELLKKENASAAAIARIGELDSSALHAVWRAAILKMRGVPLQPPNYRLKGGNQKMTDALASRLGDRIWLGCPLLRIEHGSAGITAHFRQAGKAKELEADYLVCCMSAPMLSQVTIVPGFPPAKLYALRHMPYYTETRVAFLSHTRFWEEDRLSASIAFGDKNLGSVWQMGADAATSRGFLEGSAEPGTSADEALAAFRQIYPGKSENIEQAFVFDWSHDRWCTFCETTALPPGELKKMWPIIIEPCGRIYFAGAYADDFWWGMEAATRSAHRTALAVDAA